MCGSEKSSQAAFKRYPQLKERFYSVVISFYKKAMQPTNKLVTDLVLCVLFLRFAALRDRRARRMEACYINTGHPDFISGHKAMAIVNDRINASKPAPASAPDPKSGKLAPGQINNNRDLDVDLKQEQGFFGSFWGGSAKAGQAKKKGAAAMEAPPPQLKASGTLSDREHMETEVIKLLISSCASIIPTYLLMSIRPDAMHRLQHHEADGH